MRIEKDTIIFDDKNETIRRHELGWHTTVFDCYKNIKNIIITENVKNIGDEAFCWVLNIEEVIINSKEIPMNCFMLCENLKKVVIGPNCEIIHREAFAKCKSLKSIELPNVCLIGDFAFDGCTSLKSIKIPNVTDIYGHAFEGCTSLKSVEMPNVVNINRYAFNGCISLKSIELPNIINVGGYASSIFNHCTSLKTVKLPNAISIGDYVFNDCISLESIELPMKLPKLGNHVFYNAPIKYVIIEEYKATIDELKDIIKTHKDSKCLW